MRRNKLTETSLVISWFTAEHGRIKTVAKGARRLRSPFAGRLDLFYACQIQFARSRRSDLHPLREVVLREPHEGLRAETERVALASYFVELLELVTEAEHPAPELFDLLSRALAHVNIAGASVRALTHFETEVARLLGIRDPAISPAVSIGRTYHRVPGARPALLTMLERRAT